MCLYLVPAWSGSRVDIARREDIQARSAIAFVCLLCEMVVQGHLSLISSLGEGSATEMRSGCSAMSPWFAPPLAAAATNNVITIDSLISVGRGAPTRRHDQRRALMARLGQLLFSTASSDCPPLPLADSAAISASSD